MRIALPDLAASARAGVAEPGLPQSFEAALAHGRVVQRTRNQGAAAVHLPQSAQGDEANRLDLPRLDAHGRPGGQVEAHAVGRGPVEDQRPIDLEKVEMRPDLNRPVAGVVDLEDAGGPAGVEFDRLAVQKVFARRHG